MRKLFQTFTIFLCFFCPLISSAEDLPVFFDSVQQELFFPNGMKNWKLQKNIAGENDFLFQWKDAASQEISLQYRDATPATIQGIYQGMGEETDQKIKESGGSIVVLSEFFAVVLVNDTQPLPSVNLLYGTPDGAYLWTYRVPSMSEADYGSHIRSIIFAAREHQYNVALKHGNVIMGRWGGVIYEFAKLLAARKDPGVKTVYQNLLQTSPENYDAHMEYLSITEDTEEKIQSAKIVARDAEEENLLNASADILNKDIPAFSSYPELGVEDAGLKVVLIPLPPCNPWLLQDISQIYENMVGIPVVIRRLPVKWAVPEPARSAYRPYLEKMASNIWKTERDFSDWPLSKLKEELIEKAREEGPHAVSVMNQIFKKMEEAGYQWEADPMVSWLSKAINPYFSKDPNTMVVGITELDIFSGNSNFVFSSYGGLQDSPVSVLSYAKMRAKLTGENQSRKRLTERAAKELVPACLKKLGIPRSIDPSCPYSYSSGLQRLDEKTLNLSDPVKQAIEKRKLDQNDLR